jgi:hypothetical protein
LVAGLTLAWWVGCGGAPEPIAVPIGPLHRLSGYEYDRSLSDLLGTRVEASASFAIDDPSGVFDNASDRQSDGEVVVDQFVTAAREPVRAALAPLPDEVSIPALGLGISEGWPLLIAETGSVWWAIGSSTVERVSVEVPFDGRWTVELALTRYITWLDTVGEVAKLPPVVRLRDLASGTSAMVVIERQDFVAPDRVGFTLDLPAGPRDLEIEVETTGWFGPLVRSLELRGVAADPADRETAARRQLLACPGSEAGTAACAGEVLARVGRRAWRRPLTPSEIGERVALVESELAAGASFEVALGLGLVGVLASPNFLFLVEADPPGTSPWRWLDPWEVAGRLALFLWSSAPDDALLDCAAAGGLQRDDDGPCGLDAAVARMLADPRADSLVDGFGLQWLGADDVWTATRSADLYPSFSPELAASMVGETRAVLAELLRDGRPVRDLLTQRWTFIDPVLAEHYGVPAPASGFARYVWPAGAPAGVLRHASVLTATSQASRTSPVKRGVYVTERLLCDPPDPPPAVLPPLDEDLDPREALDAHKKPGCVECHAHFEPYGLALEGWDAIGRPREVWPDGTPVRSSVELLDGAVISGLEDVAAVVSEGDAVARCFGEHLAAWALARTWDDAMAPALEPVHAEVGSAASFRDYVVAVARSDLFLRRARAAP